MELFGIKLGKKKETTKPARGIFVRLTLDGHLLGAYKEALTPCINVQDLTQEQYAEDWAGGRINFRQAPKGWHKELETGSGVLKLQSRDLRHFFERI